MAELRKFLEDGTTPACQVVLTDGRQCKWAAGHTGTHQGLGVVPPPLTIEQRIAAIAARIEGAAGEVLASVESRLTGVKGEIGADFAPTVAALKEEFSAGLAALEAKCAADLSGLGASLRTEFAAEFSALRAEFSALVQKSTEGGKTE